MVTKFVGEHTARPTPGLEPRLSPWEPFSFHSDELSSFTSDIAAEKVTLHRLRSLKDVLLWQKTQFGVELQRQGAWLVASSKELERGRPVSGMHGGSVHFSPCDVYVIEDFSKLLYPIDILSTIVHSRETYPLLNFPPQAINPSTEYSFIQFKSCI